MMKIFDTHAHYMSKDYENDVSDVLKKLKSFEVDNVCEISASLSDAMDIKTFVDKYNDNNIYPMFCYSIGIHPDEIKNYEYNSSDFNDYFDKLEYCIKNSNPVAIGEIGLDYFGDKDDDVKINQKLWFIEQIKLAKKYDLPLVVHSRDACKDTMDIMKEYADNYHGIIHCFSYEKEIANEYIKMGYVIGVGGVLTFKNARKLQETVVDIPINCIVTETDSPYLSPVPKRGERNDSTNISYVINEISRLKNVDKDELIEKLYNNALKVYNIK